MRFFSSSLAVNPAHVLNEEVDKSLRNKSTVNFCVVLSSLEKFHKVNCVSTPPPKKTPNLLAPSKQGADSNP